MSGSTVDDVGVVVEADVLSSSSLRMFLRIRNPTTTAAMAITMASVEPIGEAPLPERLGGRLGCSLLICAPPRSPPASHHSPLLQSSHDGAAHDDVEAAALSADELKRRRVAITCNLEIVFLQRAGKRARLRSTMLSMVNTTIELMMLVALAEVKIRRSAASLRWRG